MELKNFIENFSNQFDETDQSLFSENTEFRKLEEWGSLIALSIIAMIDEEYNVSIKGDEMRQANNIKELFEIVNSKL